MNADEAVVETIRALNESGIPYMVTGSFASNVYGFARSTKDADFVILASSSEASSMLGRLRAPLKVDPQLSFETVTATTRHIIELVGSHFRIEVFYLSNDAHDQERFRRRRPGMILGESVMLPSAEDVVIQKLRWSSQGRRAKDMDDARNVLAVQGDALDWAYIHRWCEAHETRELLDQILASIPKDL